MKIDKPALAKAVGVMLLSWAALPIVYYLIVRRKSTKDTKEKEVAIEENDGKK